MTLVLQDIPAKPAARLPQPPEYPEGKDGAAPSQAQVESYESAYEAYEKELKKHLETVSKWRKEADAIAASNNAAVLEHLEQVDSSAGMAAVDVEALKKSVTKAVNKSVADKITEAEKQLKSLEKRFEDLEKIVSSLKTEDK